jgi:16S rRNA A1518/A1519 N6-dimethyltransferase RsmA/KsgA/DIM1 with predicted DNA glycosylase/AP lyase activity
VSIHAVLQNPITCRNSMDFVVTTEEVKLSQVRDFTVIVGNMPFAIGQPLFMPMLSQ